LTLRSLVLVAAIVLLSGWGARGETSEENRVRVAVLPVVVHTSESRAYLREGIADMLSSRLEQVKELEVIRVEDPAMATNRASVALEEGRKLGADYVLFGSFTRFGEGASLDMQCLSVVPEEDGVVVRQIFVQSGNIGNVIPDLDDLTGKISRFTVKDFEDRASAEEPPAGTPRSESLADLRDRVRALEEALRRQGIEMPENSSSAADEGIGAADAKEGPSSSNRDQESEASARVVSR
jgi:TolB-like protein